VLVLNCILRGAPGLAPRVGNSLGGRYPIGHQRHIRCAKGTLSLRQAEGWWCKLTREVKVEAVKLIAELGVSVVPTLRALGVRRSILRRLVQASAVYRA
jgi:hypothetical protein